MKTREVPRSRSETGADGHAVSRFLDDITLLNSQAKTADLVWTRAEWKTIARFLHNDNGQHDFVMAKRGDGEAAYFKARRVTVERAISWAWRTVTDEVRHDRRTTFVPYSQNPQALSRWGCLDFDAHDGEHKRAQAFAFAAWQFLLNSDLTIIIEATGGGWHVWCIAKEFRPVRDWTLFLRSVAKAIDSPVRPGLCEVFPDDTGARHGKGVRAPGSWNPSTDSLNLILYENSQNLLSSLIRPIGKPANPSEERFTNRKSNNFSGYTGLEQGLLKEHAITEESTRHQKLLALVGQAFHKISLKQALKLIEAQYKDASVKMRASHSNHEEEFYQMWLDLSKKWTRELSQSECAKFALLSTETERDAFRIIRNFHRMALGRGDADFPVALYNLADRLDITPPGTAKLLSRLVDNGILKRTAYAVIYKAAARYAWEFLNHNERKGMR